MTTFITPDQPKNSDRFTLHLVDAQSGADRMVATTPDWGDDGYLWTDGNYGCDCNRSLFFARAAGEPDLESRECGDDAFMLYVVDGAQTVYDERG